MTGNIVLAEATPAHFDAIVAIERARAGSSVVALTHGNALTEALDRGHIIAVALSGDDVAGWVWCSIDDTRGGASIGQLHCVGTAHGSGDIVGTARALLEHARAILAERGCTHMRTTLPGDDAETAALLASLDFEIAAVIMQRPL